MTEGYFPGSQQPLRAAAGAPSRFEVPLGKPVEIGGRVYELYGIGDVAEVLNRKPGTLRKWERLDIIPKATFVRAGANGDKRGNRRLWSRPQVEALLRIAMEEKILFNLNLQISKTKFTAKVFQAFKELQ